MARITVEDCLPFVQNRFELVMVGSKRARQLATGGKEPGVEWEDDKPTVVALREIEQGMVNASILEENEEDMMLELDLEGQLNAGSGESQSEVGDAILNPEGEASVEVEAIDSVSEAAPTSTDAIEESSEASSEENNEQAGEAS